MVGSQLHCNRSKSAFDRASGLAVQADADYTYCGDAVVNYVARNISEHIWEVCISRCGDSNSLLSVIRPGRIGRLLEV